MSKYLKLWRYLKNDNRENIQLSFDEISDILGFEINHSFLNYKKELKEYGYKVNKISLKNKNVKFCKI